MALPLNQLDCHRSLVIDLYRTIIRNALHLALPKKDHFQLVLKLRKRFRTSRMLTNGVEIRNEIIKANEFNQLIVKCYDKTFDKTELLMKINPKFYSGKTNKDKKEKKEVKERPSKVHSIPTSIFLKSLPLKPYKSPLDKAYLREIIPSLIAYKQQSIYLQKLEGKLLQSSNSGAKLKRVNGTSNYLYIINTPWNRDLRTESGRWVLKVRVQYDQLITQLNQLEKAKSQYEKLHLYEQEWDRLILNEDNNWMWSFQECERVLNEEIKQVNDKVKIFNLKQGLILNKLQPLFKLNHLKSKSNLNRLLKVKNELQIGPYTDILKDGELGKLLKSHYFRDPQLKHSPFDLKPNLNDHLKF